MHDTEDFILEFVEDDDPLFKMNRGSKSFIRRFFKNKTICLSCHKPHLFKDSHCPDCDVITTRNHPDLVEKLTSGTIKSLRVGIPGPKFKTRDDSLKGDLKEFMDNEKVGMYAGYENPKIKSSVYPIGVWDLEKLHLISVKLWNILYTVEGHLGNFIEMENGTDKPFIPIEILKEYMDGVFFLFRGHHIPSNKNILIVSPKKDFRHPCFNNIKNTKKTIKETDKVIHLDKNSLLDEFKVCEWFLYFSDNENFFIVPQMKSMLDIRDKNDLKRLLNLDNALNDFTVKYALREWDIDEI
ncbi:hypothetical protein [Methanobacterium petrolearium]|uniref:hypothetical protein n=1 Tax=Methanobacterium petrolearium TaxID=710190 RepID=UPI001AE221C0|nr:hypothetical protein [Methanobacterium petrolearium]MBP1946320.1 hypothetical protein [Methanobacterium petrolearium]BDZ71420.1 hypothetical protein GCM10025861_19370 [Methanobacterium petrolearium]